MNYSGSPVVLSEQVDVGDVVVAVREVTVRFGGVVAISEASLNVLSGEIMGVIGPNGAGKTTLFDVVTGIRQPASGSVWFRGQEITNRSPVWRSRNGMRRTFQRQQPFGWLSTEDNVVAALDYHGGGGGIVADLVAFPPRRKRVAERRQRSEAILALCGLTDVASVPAGRLPIGKVRLLELARAIVDDPSLLLLDEPTSGLEEKETEKFGSIVNRVRSETGYAVLLIEHDVPFVMNLCDRVTVLELGSVIAQGTPSEVAANPVVREAYLG